MSLGSGLRIDKLVSDGMLFESAVEQAERSPRRLIEAAIVNNVCVRMCVRSCVRGGFYFCAFRR